MHTNTDPTLIEELLSRSVDTVYPDAEQLREALSSGKQMSIYVGIDPTADYVHLGHATNYLMLERFHQLGHKLIVLVGDFTAMIGDPTDKASARVRLTREEIEKNLATFKEQIGKILPFDDKKNPIEFKFNSEWLRELNFEKLADLASSFTVQQMLERDMFEKRIKEQKPLYVHEFFYPLMQGYDSVALDVDIEVGGTDQTFNMLAGRTLVKRYLGREKFVITTTLLENPATGEKMMSKSAGTGIGLNESPDQMFGKVMALPDEGIIQVFVDCTRTPLSEVEKKYERLNAGENPKNLKLELAEEIVRTYHGEDEAKAAHEAWIRTFSEGAAPEDVAEHPIERGTQLIDALVQVELASSKTDVRRLIENGAVTNLDSGEKIADAMLVIDAPIRLKVGKHRFAKFIPR
jgi:tyrosyl-tRNA synthetase